MAHDGEGSEMRDEIDPVEFLRRVMHISPEDAEDVREASPPTRPRPKDRATESEDGKSTG